MNNQERGLKIIDIFTDLREHVNKIGGYIDHNQGFIEKNPSCACIGGWLADYFKTTVMYFNEGYRSYIDGYQELAHRLDVKCVTNFVSESGLWHTDEGIFVFSASPIAYGGTSYVDINEVCADWVQFGYELVAKGDYSTC